MALAVGRVDVDEMLEQITPELLTEWMAFYTLEPFGDEWRQAALVAAEAANAGRIAVSPHLKRALTKSDMIQPEDYLSGKKSESMTPEQFEAVAAARWQRLAKSQST